MIHTQLNQPDLTDPDEAVRFLQYLSRLVKRGRPLRIGEEARPGVTLRYMLYAKSAPKRGRK